MRRKDIIDFYKQDNIARIVINSDQRNVFVVKRNRGNITTN